MHAKITESEIATICENMARHRKTYSDSCSISSSSPGLESMSLGLEAGLLIHSRIVRLIQTDSNIELWLIRHSSIRPASKIFMTGLSKIPNA